jgi:Tfp pilus assembly protein PilX
MVEKRNTEKTNGYAIPVQLHIVTKVKKNSSDKDLSLDIKFEEVNPEGKTVNSSSAARFEIKKQFKTFRVRVNYTPLLIDKSGEYTIRVLIKESDENNFTEVDRIPLEVNIAEAMKFNGNI